MRSVAVMNAIGKREIAFAGEERKFFVGVDVHKASFSVTVMDEECPKGGDAKLAKGWGNIKMR